MSSIQIQASSFSARTSRLLAVYSKLRKAFSNGSDRRGYVTTPISEQAIVGAALGAAVTGLRPVAEIMFADFAGVCFDQIAQSTT